MMHNIDWSIVDNVYVIVLRGQAALHIATSHNQLKIVGFPIVKGAKLYTKDSTSASVLLAM